jgi:hypothetical protein
MNIYLLQQDKNKSYDCYDSFVVVSKSKQKALTYYPNHEFYKDTDMSHNRNCGWTSDLNSITVECIGKANQRQKEGTIICSSFNAG